MKTKGEILDEFLNHSSLQGMVEYAVENMEVLEGFIFKNEEFLNYIIMKIADDVENRIWGWLNTDDIDEIITDKMNLKYYKLIQYDKSMVINIKGKGLWNHDDIRDEIRKKLIENEKDEEDIEYILENDFSDDDLYRIWGSYVEDEWECFKDCMVEDFPKFCSKDDFVCVGRSGGYIGVKATIVGYEFNRYLIEKTVKMLLTDEYYAENFEYKDRYSYFIEQYVDYCIEKFMLPKSEIDGDYIEPTKEAIEFFKAFDERVNSIHKNLEDSKEVAEWLVESILY